MAKPTAQSQQRGMRIQRRSLTIVPALFNDEEQSVGIVITTPTPVRTWIPDPSWTGPANECTYIEGDEVLLASGLDYSRTPGMPLCDGHNTGRVSDVLGNVENVRAEGENVVGTAVYLPELSNLYQNVKKGFYRQISAGYQVRKYLQVERTDGVPVPLFHAVDWTLYETSHVPIGADAQATVRSHLTEIPMPIFQRSVTSKREDNPMADDTNLSDLVDAADAALQAVVDASDDGATDDTVARAAKLRKLRADDTEKTDAPNDGADANPDADTEAKPADEDKAVDQARSIARERGLLPLFNDLRKVGAGSRSINKALLNAMVRGAAVDTQTYKPVDKRSAEPVIDTRAIYANINSRKAK